MDKNYTQICFENGNKYHQVQPSRKSDKGCIGFKAKNGTEKDVYITTWIFNSDEIRSKCLINCERKNGSCSCDQNNTEMSTIIAALFFKARANYLIQNVDHTNLVRYIDVSCKESNGILTIHLVQDYINGAKSVRTLSEEGILTNIAPITEWLVKVVHYLEKMNPKIGHKYINDGSIFLDKAGTYYFADFHLIPYLMYLKSTYGWHETDDIKALGSFINDKNKAIQESSEDFVNLCCSNEKPTCRELLEHTFLSNVHIGDASTVYSGPLLNQFEVQEVLGRGAYGSVVKAKQPANQEHFALKIIKIPIGSKGTYTKVKRESGLIPQINHKNIVKYFGSWEQTVDVNEIGISFDDEESSSGSGSHSSDLASNNNEKANTSGTSFVDVIIIQMELCSMDLKKAIKEGQAQNKSTRLRWFEEILNALSYLHENNIIHRDLNPANILLDSKGHVKISDFGMAITIDLIREQRLKNPSSSGGIKARSSQTGHVGTSYYIAPELIGNATSSDYGPAADIYSLGIVFFEMLHPPFQTTMERAKTLEAIRSDDITFPSSMSMSRDFNTETELIKKMLDHNPKIRPSAATLIRCDLDDEGLDVIEEETSFLQNQMEAEVSNNIQNDSDIYDDYDNNYDDYDYESDYASENGTECSNPSNNSTEQNPEAVKNDEPREYLNENFDQLRFDHQ